MEEYPEFVASRAKSGVDIISGLTPELANQAAQQRADKTHEDAGKK